MYIYNSHVNPYLESLRFGYKLKSTGSLAWTSHNRCVPFHIGNSPPHRHTWTHTHTHEHTHTRKHTHTCMHTHTAHKHTHMQHTQTHAIPVWNSGVTINSTV